MLGGSKDIADKVCCYFSRRNNWEHLLGLYFQIRPLMKASFQNVLYVGKVGSAMIPKVFSNILVAVNIVAAGEAMMVAKKAGIDLKTFWDCIRSSSGNSFVWETGGPMVMQGTYDPSFTIGLHCKDNQLCFEIAKKYKVTLTMT